MASSVRPTVKAESVRFVENGAGTYTYQMALPPEAILLDVVVHGEALWTAATSATLIVGDTTDDDGIYTAVNLKATDLLAGEGLSFAQCGGKYGADLVPNDATGASLALGAAGQVNRRFISGGRTVQAKVTSVGAGTAGRTIVTFIYATPDVATVTQ